MFPLRQIERVGGMSVVGVTYRDYIMGVSFADR